MFPLRDDRRGIEKEREREREREFREKKSEVDVSRRINRTY